MGGRERGCPEGKLTVSQHDHAAAVAEPEVKEVPKDKKKPKRQPRYNVILWNDDDHTYDYVVRMMQDLFGHEYEKGVKIAIEVDTRGKAICLTTTLEHAELKRDQIHAYGKNKLIARCKGSMAATIEPEVTS
jgi:ATP-dependent Clp protease adaptor protein ClpS